ncbi:hypothetical protein, partial [Enterococcus faecalis]|uniref:hypothetical protein n=1 Tax=Enterococcus faecalis TaxID=1351 RepID=UPI00403F28BF
MPLPVRLVPSLLAALGLAALALGLAPGPAVARPPKAPPAAVSPNAPLEAALRRHVETLAGDDFGGREPGTDGE